MQVNSTSSPNVTQLQSLLIRCFAMETTLFAMRQIDACHAPAVIRRIEEAVEAGAFDKNLFTTEVEMLRKMERA